MKYNYSVSINEYVKKRYILSGVGICLEGMPDNIKKFYFILSEQGCHPKATHRILSRINKNGFDLLTVMNYLDFDWIFNELKKIKVSMTFIDPLDNWVNKYEDGKWPDWALPEKFKKVL